MTTITGITRGGAPWTPRFVTALSDKRCIGCGRCYKVCPRDVFELEERDEDEELELEADDEDEDDDDYGGDDDNTMVMRLKNALDCIGCEACAKVCPKKCLTHEAVAA
jgi:Nif-specific ferredoxin III